MTPERAHEQNKTGFQAGFTLIELVITLIVIAVVAVTAATRLQDNTGYTEFTLQQRLISALRHVQYQAMQDDRAGFCYQLVLRSGAAPAFGPSTANYQNGQQAASCGSAIATSSPDYLRASTADIAGEGVTLATREAGSLAISVIGFDNLGRPLTNNNNCQRACQVTFTGTSAASVCIESEGFIYAC